jgi:glyoxylase-like metal-dependent hydrolase (beta-lactamase superfamily II)
MADEPVEVYEVPNGGWDPRVRVFRHGTLVDTCVVVTERYLVLVDTGARPESMATVMDRLADVVVGRQLLVLNTHADWDHYWGNGLFSGPQVQYPAPILGHHIAVQRADSEEARATLAEMKTQHPGELANVRLLPPTIAFTPPLTIDGGDLTVEVIATPGHQPDHVAIWIPAIRLLWAADAAEAPWPFANEPFATLPILRASLARMAALEPEWALYCHAPDIASPVIITQNQVYFDTLEAYCRAALASGLVGAADVAASADPVGLPDRIDFPAAAALAPGTDPAVLDSGTYPRAHARNTQVMLGWLLSTNP